MVHDTTVVFVGVIKDINSFHPLVPVIKDFPHLNFIVISESETEKLSEWLPQTIIFQNIKACALSELFASSNLFIDPTGDQVNQEYIDEATSSGLRVLIVLGALDNISSAEPLIASTSRVDFPGALRMALEDLFAERQASS